jgi:FkbM family methyltransferase
LPHRPERDAEMALQFIKDVLVRLGPDNALVQAALRLFGRRQGYEIEFANGCILLRKADRELILNKAQYVQVPVTMECFDLFFNTLEGESSGNGKVLDFSKPNLHRYVRSQVELYFPAIPEDDVMDAYSDSYQPKPGDVVWDAGAHAGATTYFLAEMVGPQGKVYAFEPDDLNFQYLKRNIELRGLRHVIPVKKALAGDSGTAEFCMDGTMCAGLGEYLVYSDKSRFRTVATVSLPDACAELGEVPVYVKMDIEGAEVVTIEGAQSFLKENPIHFAIESYHRIQGELTCKALEPVFSGIGYKVRSSDKFGQMFTWADPCF